MSSSREAAPAGVVLGGGETAVWVLSAALAGTTSGRAAALPGVAGLVACASLAAVPVVAACLATGSWAFLVGFDESRYGVLTWHQGDGWRLAVLVVVALTSSLLGARARRPGTEPAFEAWIPRPRPPVE